MTLSELRKKNGITQKQIAEELHVTERTIKAWEAASKSSSNSERLKRPSIDYIINMSKVLGLAPIEIYECFSNTFDDSSFNNHESPDKGDCVAITEHLSRLPGSEQERLLSGIISDGRECFQFTNHRLNQISDEDFLIDSDFLHNGFAQYKGILFFDNHNHSVYLDNKDTIKPVKYNRNSFGITFSFLSSRNILTGEVSAEPTPFQIIFLYNSLITNSDNPLIVKFDKNDDDSKKNGSKRLGKILEYQIKTKPYSKEMIKKLEINKDRISRLINRNISSYNDIRQVSLITKLPVEELLKIYSDDTLKFYAKFKELKVGYNSCFANISNGEDIIDFIKYCTLANETLDRPTVILLYESTYIHKLNLCNTHFHVAIEGDVLNLSSNNGETLKLDSKRIIEIKSLESKYNCIYTIIVEYQIEDDVVPLLIEISIPNTVADLQILAISPR